MIITDKTPCITSVLQDLDDSHFEFYLTGPHYFFPIETITNHSIDFFAQKSEEILEFLVHKLHFHVVTNPVYIDTQTATLLWCGAVNIQLVQNVTLKQRAQRKIAEAYPRFFTAFSLDHQNSIWSTTYLLCS